MVGPNDTNIEMVNDFRLRIDSFLKSVEILNEILKHTESKDLDKREKTYKNIIEDIAAEIKKKTNKRTNVERDLYHFLKTYLSYVNQELKLGVEESKINENVFINDGRLTPFGMEFTKMANEIRNRMNSLETMTAKYLKNEQYNNSLTIGCISTHAKALLPQCIKEFREKYHHVNISLLNGESENLRRWLESYKIDIAITTNIDSFQHGIERVEISKSDYPVMIYPKNLDKDQRKDIPMILFPYKNTWRRKVEECLKEEIMGPVSIETNSMENILYFVSAGLGKSCVPYSTVKKGNYTNIEIEELTEVEEDRKIKISKSLPTSLLFRKEDKENEMIRYMVDIIKKVSP